MTSLTTLICVLFNTVLVAGKSKTCSQEVHVRTLFAERFANPSYTGIGGGPLGPALVRMVFHDALDKDNLVKQDGSESSFKPGGVDACLHSTLLQKKDGSASSDPDHNRGLRTGVRAKDAVRNKANGAAAGHADTMVLGAIVAIEDQGMGPPIDYVMGRVDGHCPGCSGVRHDSAVGK